ncbi:hypothetical protein RE9431_26260 [Prescottella equi]|nr:hypothetical protein RE9431_26260 [Prescottella equi]BCN74019.1 hypothetical protein RE0327_26180 [Prescottella equi]
MNLSVLQFGAKFSGRVHAQAETGDIVPAASAPPLGLGGRRNIDVDVDVTEVPTGDRSGSDWPR